MAAVLADAVHRMRESSRKGRGWSREEAWFASADRGWPFSFENICDVLDLNSDWLRKSVIYAHTSNS